MTRRYTRTEIAVGVFTILGAIAIGYLSTAIAGLHLAPQHRYPVEARFASVGELRERARVKIAGVAVGTVAKIELKDYAARAVLEIDMGVELPTDTIASIKTEGLLGDAYVSLSPGASERNIAPGGRIMQTEPALNIIDLVKQVAFGNAGLGEGAQPDQEPAGKGSKAHAPPRE